MSEDDMEQKAFAQYTLARCTIADGDSSRKSPRPHRAARLALTRMHARTHHMQARARISTHKHD